MRRSAINGLQDGTGACPKVFKQIQKNLVSLRSDGRKHKISEKRNNFALQKPELCDSVETAASTPEKLDLPRIKFRLLELPPCPAEQTIEQHCEGMLETHSSDLHLALQLVSGLDVASRLKGLVAVRIMLSKQQINC